MRKQTRWLILCVAAILLPSLLLFQMSEAKRVLKKKPPAGASAKKTPLKNSVPMISPQTSSLSPVSARAVGFAVSPNVRDLPPEEIKTDPFDDSELKQKPIKVFRIESATEPSADAAVQLTAPAPAIPSSTSFEGISIFDTITLGQGFLPPDTEGDVGPNHYVQSVNSTWRVWNKAGAPLTPVMTLGSLWASIPGPCANTNAGDPIVLYDSYADRWLISQFCTVANPNNHQLIAISKTSDPTGAYFLYDFMMPNNKFNDYPKFGVWPDGYYMTDNQFNQAGTAFLGGGAFAFDRAKMLAGNPTASFIYFDLFPLDPNLGGMLPSDADGLTPPPAGAPNVFAYFIATEFGDPSDGLRLFDFHADFAVPANSTFIERAESPVAVAAFDPNTPTGRDDIEQPPPAINTAEALDAIGDRLMNRLQYRNFGTHQSLIVNHTVNVGTGTTQALHQAGVRYYELRRAGASYAVNEQATFAPDTTNRWMGSAAMDHEGNLAVGFSVSSTTVFPGVRYAGRLAGDPPGGLFQGEATMQPGGFVQRHTSSRWGDYSSTNLDPIDDCTFWHTNEYYLNDQPSITAEWHTRIGNFKVNPTCVAPQQGTLQVNVTNCSTGLPVAGALVNINGNLYGATGASGANSSQLSPGSYTVNVSANGYFPSAPLAATITNGNTTVINVCLVGSPNIQAAGSTITAESCTPADNAISPGETVTLDFGMKNNGTAPTSSLVATLQATGGVTSPSGPQNYGAIPPDNTTVVSRSFTFVADPSASCGSNITATFALQDGANNLGTVTFTYTLGALSVGSTTASYSTGNITVPIPDVSTVDIPLTVTDTGSITDVNVKVRLNHTFDGDLELKLVAPDGTEVMLSDNRGSSGDNFGTGANDCSGVHTVFDDSASTAISAGVAPFAGSFKPEIPLSALNGKNSAGTWKLRVSDTAALDVGTVGCFQLEISRRRFVCCGVAGSAEVVAVPPAVVTTESCSAPNGAVDPEETITANFPLRNNGDGSTTNLVATLLAGGGITPQSGPQSYGVLSPLDPNPTSRPFTFVAQGTCGSMVTATLHLQDGANDLGNVTFTFRLGTTVTGTTTFSNNSAVTILDTPRIGGIAPSSPYPSNILVSGVTGTVTRVAVRLKNLNHTFPGDVDMLLVSPGGQKMIILSDAIGSTDWVNITYLLDDTAAALVPSTGTPVSGTFRPTNYGTGDTFPAPAPVAPYQTPATAGAATFGSVFGGGNPNGTWSLYIVDDAGIDAGSLAGGWDLIITTEDPVCCDSACTLTCPDNIVVNNDPGQCGANVTYDPVDVNGSCGVVTYSHPSGSFFPVGTTTVTVTSTRADNTSQSCTFTVTVNDTEGPATGPLTASPNSLSPPNHLYRDVTLTYSPGTDNCGGAVTCVVTSITSNEPINGTGDGDTAPDWQIISPTLVRLRAERAGGGTGRVYTITVRCTDQNGNHTFRTTTVTVPH
jgi:subtilisin-like proprotein convertase family protein